MSVITTVGPYQLYGNELLAACVATGTDYFDLCGEPIWMRQMIDKHEAAAKRAARASCSPAATIRVPFELGVFFVQEEAKTRFGAPAPRVKGRVRDMQRHASRAAPRRARRRPSMRWRRISALSRSCNDPFALTPGFDGPKQPQGNRPLFEEDLQSWTAPFVMAIINTRNVHRSNMLMGFPYGQDFVYDEMVLTGPGEKGEANAKLVMAANDEKTGPDAPKPGEGPSKEERENGQLRPALHRDRARRPPGSRRRQGRPRSRLRLDLEDDLRMRDLPAARCARRRPPASGRRARRCSTS